MVVKEGGLKLIQIQDNGTGIRVSKTPEEQEWWLPGFGGGDNGELLMGTVSVWEHERVLDIDVGDSCTAV